MNWDIERVLNETYSSATFFLVFRECHTISGSKTQFMNQAMFNTILFSSHLPCLYYRTYSDRNDRIVVQIPFRKSTFPLRSLIWLALITIHFTMKEVNEWVANWVDSLLIRSSIMWTNRAYRDMPEWWSNKVVMSWFTCNQIVCRTARMIDFWSKMPISEKEVY